MQNPVYNLKCIIDDAIDLYRAIFDNDSPLMPEELIKAGKDIKRKTEGLIDMAWYHKDSKDWEEKHPGNVGTSL